jgi:hypothetical protein
MSIEVLAGGSSGQAKNRRFSEYEEPTNARTSCWHIYIKGGEKKGRKKHVHGNSSIVLIWRM